MTHIYFGPPGTGKTRKLIEKVEEHLNKGISPETIGFFTFSKKAARDVRDRMNEKFGLSEDSLPYFRTLHSLGFEVLNYTKEMVMKSEDYKKIGEKCGIEVNYASWDEDNGGIFTSDSPYLSLINLAKSKNITVEQQYNLGQHKEDLDSSVLYKIEREIINYKKDTKKIDFNDMISEMVSKNIYRNFSVSFIDEAQDLSIVQWKLGDLIEKNSGSLYVAGDDDQCIYPWRGADVKSFLNLKGTREVLKTSWRVPQEVFNLAQRIIHKIPKNNRVQKEWRPREERGSVTEHYDISELQNNLKTGEWLILGRDKWRLNELEEFLKDHNIYYERAKKNNPMKDKYAAIDLYENKLKKGKALSYEECHEIKKKMLKNEWKPSLFKAMVKNKFYTMDMLKSDFGLNTDLPWQAAFTRMGKNDTDKINELIKRGEDLKNGARIKLATIHGVKGNERDNVVLSFKLSKACKDAYITNPDDEHRVMYTGTTRTKNNLHIILGGEGDYDK